MILTLNQVSCQISCQTSAQDTLTKEKFIQKLKGMLRRNTEHFLKNAYLKNWEFLKSNDRFFFSISNGLYFLFLCNYEHPSSHFIFG